MAKEIKSIKIAPDIEEITIEGDVMHTDFAGGITYTAEGMGLMYKDTFLKCAFQEAIALASKRWILEQCLNDYLHLNGKIS